MLKVFRQKGVAKKVLWVVAGIIIISFAFGFSLARYNKAEDLSASAGKVFGRNVSRKAFKAEYMNVRDQAILMHGANADNILPLMDMDNQTWVRIMLLKEADRRGIKAADGEVVMAIGQIPAFQRDGGFDRKLYEMILARIFKREARDFEESIRGQIRIMKIFQIATRGIVVTDEKAREEYLRRNRKVKAAYILLEPKDFAKGLAIDDKDAGTYYDAHREDFLEPESVNVRFLTIPVNAKASADDKAQALKRAAALVKKASAGADLNALAKAEALAVKETGLFNMDTPPLELGWPLETLAAIFQAKANAVLAPVETSDSIQVLQLMQKNIATIPGFEKAKALVKERMIAEKSLQLAKDKAGEALAGIEKGFAASKDFYAAAKSVGMVPKETPLFATGEYVSEIGMSEDFTSAVFRLTKEKPLSPVILTSKGPVIASLITDQPADEKKFDETKTAFIASLYQEERANAIDAFVSEVRTRAGLEVLTGTH